MKAFSDSGQGLSATIRLTQKPKIPKALCPIHRFVGFFDGASQNASSQCGAGAILQIDDLCHYKLWMNCCFGTNTKG